MTTLAPAPRPSGAWSTAAGFLLGQGIVLALLLGPLASQSWWAGMRDYFAFDQLGYLAIATNVANGDSPLVEPFTLTGSSYYPPLWLTVIGLASRATGVPVHLTWTVLGLLAVCLAVALVGWLGYRYSRRWYAPVLPALLLATGLLTAPTFGGWGTALASRAVIWGPYGTLFPLNSEVAGLAGAVLSTVLLMLAWPVRTHVPPPGPRRRAVLVTSAAACIGLLANLHTYSFFSAMLLATLYVAVRSLLRWPSRTRVLVTLGAVAVALVAGRVLAGLGTPLPAFGLLLLALVPAAWPGIRAHPRLAAGPAAVLALLAAPQVLRAAAGVSSGDPFLTFRQAMPNMQDLGIPIGTALLAAAPLLVLGAAVLLVGVRRHEHGIVGLVASLGLGWLLMSQNDAWGFAQEPYRFWLQFETLGALLLAPALAWALVAPASSSVRWRRTVPVLLATGAVLWAVSLTALPSFWSYASAPLIPLTGGRETATQELIADATDALFLPSACMRPQVAKAVTGGRVGFYSREFAWPSDPDLFDALPTMTDVRTVGGDALRAAGVRYVLTDSGCADEWESLQDSGLVMDASRPYDADGTTYAVTRWRVP